MDTIDRLIEQFRQFPGIGPRQAKRFVYFLLGQPESYRSSLSKSLTELGRQIHVCSSCQRFFPMGAKNSAECVICSDPNRSNETLLVVSRDVDLENIEKSRSYTGKYFVLGGSVPILEKDPESRIRLSEFKALIEKRVAATAAVTATASAKDSSLKEIILALSLTPEGENTEEFLRAELTPFLQKIVEKTPAIPAISLSTLGRGLSTGLELEYSDGDTIKNALKNRA